ncbi:SMP-30/gluconolactonase/LRE family protein [Paenibacillus radicis (ex Gao et al. 2016)]|uniref:Phage head-tail adapter protein n=1 Tax=Paenibacillus radicis (ex Gao et al. 2016) TaxID=1737354 RepID=A0A917LRY7_9BACL|nr:phage head-tail adapter protein [Paenibacillus radicis (ex Gao et al. 2016)]GGG54075.1 phage head-tail adapter protein [Paenibacillus radicis (ex Gao et al. 2016)]
MNTPQLFALLPEEHVTTPDGMAIAADGDLVLSCPNFADHSRPACLVKINADRQVRKWVEVPVHPDTGIACPMGIAFGPDGDIYVCDNQGWSGSPEGSFQGRILRLRIENDQVVSTTIVAQGMEHPNGIRIRDGYMYVTQSVLTKVQDPTGLLRSCVYRFGLDEEGIQIHNNLDDPHMLTSLLTLNENDQYGADGIEFDPQGNLYVGNFGDGAVHKITFHPDGSVKDNIVWAKNPEQLQTTDGMVMDEAGNLYIADFSANAIAKVYPDGTVERYAQSPDSDGFQGELDQPSEPIIWNGKLIVSCFDLVTGPGKVNTKHELPATMSELDL